MYIGILCCLFSTYTVSLKGQKYFPSTQTASHKHYLHRSSFSLLQYMMILHYYLCASSITELCTSIYTLFKECEYIDKKINSTLSLSTYNYDQRWLVSLETSFYSSWVNSITSKKKLFCVHLVFFLGTKFCRLIINQTQNTPQNTSLWLEHSSFLIQKKIKFKEKNLIHFIIHVINKINPIEYMSLHHA